MNSASNSASWVQKKNLHLSTFALKTSIIIKPKPPANRRLEQGGNGRMEMMDGLTGGSGTVRGCYCSGGARIEDWVVVGDVDKLVGFTDFVSLKRRKKNIGQGKGKGKGMGNM